MKTLWEYCAEFEFAYVDQAGVVFILNMAALEDFGELIEGPRPSNKYLAKIESWLAAFGLGPVGGNSSGNEGNEK
jgi:hypothetical protein